MATREKFIPSAAPQGAPAPRFQYLGDGIWLDTSNNKEFTHAVTVDATRLGHGRALLAPNKRYPVGGFPRGDGLLQIGTVYEDGTVPEGGLPLHYFTIEYPDVRPSYAKTVALQQIVDSVAHITGATHSVETKATNPKEADGAGRIPLHYIPDGPLAQVAMAFYEGGGKYGPYNWRVAGVRASTYVAAARRHIGKWWNGDDTDPKSRVHHLANAVAGLLIVLDAEIQGMLVDDRPPKQDLEGLYEKLRATQEHLHQLHKGLNPPTYTQREHAAQVLAQQAEIGGSHAQ